MKSGGVKVVGLDIASKMGIVMLHTNGDCLERMFHVKHKKGVHPLDRFEMYAEATILVCEGADLVAIEDYAVRFVKAAIPLITQGTFVRQAVHALGIPYIEVPPNTLKKFVTGSGNAKKPDMIKSVNHRWGNTITDDNIADAYGLAKIAQMMLTTKTDESLLKLREKYHDLNV